ncbi:MAG: cell division protein FtsK [Peptococcaceae bacterium BICA1-7]|nr:MAG: cell division protein FtsK [Peptococcaceae bacterium BICA1-7]HBV97027.1 DNA translocase FtsK [Desulfotomaculum sp.]
MAARNKRKAPVKQSSPAAERTDNNLKYEILGIGIITLASLGTASLFTTALGAVGALLGRIMEIIAGEARYLVIISLVLLGIKLIREKSSFKITPRTAGFIILLLVFLTLASLDIPREQLMRLGYGGAGGGIIGAASVYAATGCFGTVGTYIVLASLSLVSLLLITGYTLGQLGFFAALRARKAGSGAWRWVFNFLTEEVNADDEDGEDESSRRTAVITGTTPAQEEALPSHSAAAKENGNGVDKNKKKVSRDRVEIADIPPLPLADGRIYRLPPGNLLKLPENTKNEVSDKEMADRAKTLESTLESFSIQAKVVGVSVGPAITRYEIQPPPGIKVSRIVGLADDIALNLAVPGVRIEAPIPGKAAVGIEVPNREVSPVTLRELMESREFKNSPSRLSVALGKDLAGAPIVGDLGKMPHLLVAGATGAGKSVCINTIIASILFKATPDEVKLLMVDPKMVELTNYNGIPHLISPVVTDAKKAAGTLRWAVKEMERRYEAFATAGVRDISRYNKTHPAEPGGENQPMPFVVIIIDELADLMMVAPADVEDSICRLAQMARAAGIHLVIATQRPSVDVITGLIKANIPSRISFAVSSLVDSRTILDMGGAEKLLGRGDMLFLPVGAAKPIRLQGAFLSDQEVEGLVDYLKEQAQPVYDEQVLTAPPASEGSGDADDDHDDLLVQAVKLFIESGTASISLLQRRLHIGYARAARLVDIMERRGIVGGFEGSKPRSIRMTLEQFEQTFREPL